VTHLRYASGQPRGRAAAISYLLLGRGRRENPGSSNAGSVGGGVVTTGRLWTFVPLHELGARDAQLGVRCVVLARSRSSSPSYAKSCPFLRTEARHLFRSSSSLGKGIQSPPLRPSAEPGHFLKAQRRDRLKLAAGHAALSELAGIKDHLRQRCKTRAWFGG